MQAIITTIIIGIIVFSLSIISRMSSKYKSFFNILTLLTLTYFILGVASFIGPAFFRMMNYNVTENFIITASDASSFFLDSLLAVVISYLLIDMK